METSHVSRRRLKEIRSLARRKYRAQHGEMLVEGWRSVQAAVTAGAPIREILIASDVETAAQHWLRDGGHEVHLIDRSELERISDVEASQGIVAVVGMAPAKTEALDAMQRVVVLDGVQDPGNAGTIIRSAAWFGVEAIVTAPGAVDVYNPKVVRAAMGGLWDVEHAAVDDLPDELDRLRERGFAVYAADLDGVQIDEWVPRTPSVVILGSEAHGISEELARQVDERIVIPGRPRRRGTESLNVAVAAGILLHEWTRRR